MGLLNPSYIRKYIEVPVSRSDFYRLNKKHEPRSLRHDVAVQIFFMTEALSADFDGGITPNGSIKADVLNSSNSVTLGPCHLKELSEDSEVKRVCVDHIHFPRAEPIRVIESDTKQRGKTRNGGKGIGKAYIGVSEVLVSVEGCNPVGNQLIKIRGGASTSQGSADEGLEIDLLHVIMSQLGV